MANEPGEDPATGADAAHVFEVGGRRARGSPGKRCYAIGDVHGRLDLLNDLLARIEADDASRPPRETVLVLMGDLIDRGPDSRGVIERLRDRPPTFCKTFAIKGNHEECLLRGLAGESGVLQNWLVHGGYACAQSYGAPIGRFFGASEDMVRDVLSQYIPRQHLTFMDAFLDTVRFGDFLLAHAGVRPGAPLERMARDVRWIREPFLSSDADLGWIVVHGHTISADAQVRSNRIGIDTGAYQTGVLTAVRIEDEVCGFLRAVGDPGGQGAPLGPASGTARA